MKKAYRQQYSFANGENAEKYEIFLKKQLLKLSPNFYGLTHRKKIKTTDGFMLAIRLTTAIEDPTLETVAECWINNQLIYLWRDRCWTIAIDQNKKLLYRLDYMKDGNIGTILANHMLQDNLMESWRQWTNKSVLIYPVGTDPVL